MKPNLTRVMGPTISAGSHTRRVPSFLHIKIHSPVQIQTAAIIPEDYVYCSLCPIEKVGVDLD